MTFAHNPGTTAALKIEKKRRCKGERSMKVQRNPLFEPRPDRTAAHFIEGVTIPPAFHVGLAEGESAAGQDASEKAFIMDTNIPGALSSQTNVCGGEKVFNDRLCQARARRPLGRARRLLLRSYALLIPFLLFWIRPCNCIQRPAERAELTQKKPRKGMASVNKRLTD